MNAKGAKGELLAEARHGDALAQKRLGMLLCQSDDTLKEGVSWLKKAATIDADAMYLLGRVCLKRQDDAKQAFGWYQKAAQKGHSDAMIDLGAFYLFGGCVECDIRKAVEWYKKAANLGSPVGFHNLGFLCFQDDKMYGKALSFFKEGSQLGYADSSYMLGVMHLYGYGTEKNEMVALRYFELSDEQGKHYTCRPVGDLYFQGVFDDGVQNPEKAIEWYSRGMKAGDLSCTEALGDCYYYGFGVETDYDLAHDIYQIAAGKGSKDAAFLLGGMYIKGNPVSKNLRVALKWMLLAARLGHEKAIEFVETIEDVLDNDTPKTVQKNGGSVGFKLKSSYSAVAEAIEAEQQARFEAEKARNESLYAAAGAISGSGSYTDYEMGVVIGADGEVTYVDAKTGTFMNAKGNVYSHDSESGMTYNWKTNEMYIYDETFKSTMNIKTGQISHFDDGYTYRL